MSETGTTTDEIVCDNCGRVNEDYQTHCTGCGWNLWEDEDE